MGIFKHLSLSKKSLKYKLLIAFSIMSIVPLLVIAYFVTNYVFSDAADMFQASAIILFAVWLVWTGYVMVKEIINPIIELAVETKSIANGQYNSEIFMGRDDELGDIANAVNTMTGKMRNYIGELQEYSKRTATLNVKIHRKVLTLTNLMRLGDIISSGAGFGDIANFAAERLSGEMYGGFCAIFIKERMTKYELKALHDNSGREDMNISSIESRIPEIEKLLLKHEHLIVDSNPLRKPWQQELRQELGQMNVIFFPMKIKATIVGLLVLGNFAEGVTFDAEDIEVLRAFENELILGYQSTVTAEKMQSLEIVDSLTGLYSFNYLKERLEDEINRAIFYQRPCSLVVVDIDNYGEYKRNFGEKKTEIMLKHVSKLLSEMRPPIGKVARFGEQEFGMLLPEMNKRESLEVGENIRKRIEELALPADSSIVTVSVGVGENPIDGSTATEVIRGAREYIKKAKEQGKNKVVGE